MNIFYLDRNPVKSAEYHCDRHVVKMVLETAQLLSTVHHHVGDADSKLYRKTHFNHPCAVWARSSQKNYWWLCRFGNHLGAEYTHRYGRIHKSHEMMLGLKDIRDLLPNTPFTEPPKCVHDSIRDIPDVVDAYREYYIRFKKDFCTWTNRPVPDWFRV